MRNDPLIPSLAVVTDIRVDTPDVKTFRVVGLDGKKPFVHIPGQCAMLSMPGVGEQAAQNIVDERANGKFLSAEDLAVRCNKVSKSVIELLEQIGALGSMPKSTQMSLF